MLLILALLAMTFFLLAYFIDLGAIAYGREMFRQRKQWDMTCWATVLGLAFASAIMAIFGCIFLVAFAMRTIFAHF